MKITVPELSLVVLMGPSGAGKSTFARRHFRPTEVLSSDYFRGLVADDETDQAASVPAFEVLHLVVRKRLAAGKLAVIDATNVQPEARKPLLAMAREYHCFAVAIAIDLPAKLCRERNVGRPDRDLGGHVIRMQAAQLRRSLRGLEREGFRRVYVLSSPEEVEAAAVERQKLWTDRRDERGPFDIVGDVHGCHDELAALLAKLGYEITRGPDGGSLAKPPAGRKAIFLGDLVDRGPDSPGVLRLVMGMVEAGDALCIPGNHDVKFLKKLRGRDVRITHGLAETLRQLEREPPEFRERVAGFLDGLIGHYVLDGGKLVVAHAGMKEEYQGRASSVVREFALYGETTGESDEFGLPVRLDWAADYRGKALVVYGHTPVAEAEWVNGTINIDTGCVFGGKLTALRYPERELVSVPAARQHAVPKRPMVPQAGPPPLTAQQAHDDVLDLDAVLGKRIIATRLGRTVTVREENAMAALEAMSRFAANPKWLIYLPPTMSPAGTSERPGFLEHPAEAFAYFREEGIPRAICEEKHMGSRAVVIACRDEDAARKRFGVTGEGKGVCYTRTGRRFFNDQRFEAECLDRLGAALDGAGFWEAFRTSWACFDCELMPWSLKAADLIRNQYAAVGAASRGSLAAAAGQLAAVAERGVESGGIAERLRERLELADLYLEAYGRYAVPFRSFADVKLAPFHLLATEGAVHADKDHAWHMETLAAICRRDEGLLKATPWIACDLTDPESERAATTWWEELTGRGGEGMVVKPLDFVARGRRGLVQPALKSRGREYLRIIYGPEYTRSEHLGRLRARAVAGKRSLALREFLLGLEALHRFVAGEPLGRIHECVFAVLALESEPIDPRL